MSNPSFFYNHYTLEVVEAPCRYHELESWGITNANLLGFPKDSQAHNFSTEYDTKRFGNILLEQGWSYGSVGNNNHCCLHAANIELGKDMLYRLSERKKFESAALQLNDLDCVRVDTSHLKHLFTTGQCDTTLFNKILERNSEINNLIEELKNLDCSEQTFVFGSVTKGKLAPPDIDIWIDSTQVPINPLTQEKILELSEIFFSYLDPYIRIPNGLLALGPGACADLYNWVDLKNESRIWESIEGWDANQKSSIPLRDLPLLPTTLEELFPQKKKSLKF